MRFLLNQTYECLRCSYRSHKISGVLVVEEGNSYVQLLPCFVGTSSL